MAKEDIGKLIQEETERRLEVMKSNDYEWPKKATKFDLIGIVAMLVVASSLILACMMGVIE